MAVSRPSSSQFTPEQLQTMYQDAYKAMVDEKIEIAKSRFRAAAEQGHTPSILEFGRFCFDKIDSFYDIERTEICSMLNKEAKDDNINASLIAARIQNDKVAEEAIINSVAENFATTKLSQKNAWEVYKVLSEREEQKAQDENLPDRPACLNRFAAYRRMLLEGLELEVKQGDLTAMFILTDVYIGYGVQVNTMASIETIKKYRTILKQVIDRDDLLGFTGREYAVLLNGGTLGMLELFRQSMNDNHPLYEDETKSYEDYPKPLIIDADKEQDLYSFLMSRDWIRYKPEILHGYFRELAKQGFKHPAFPKHISGCEQTAQNSESFAVHKVIIGQEKEYEVNITKLITDFAGINVTRGNNLLFWQENKLKVKDDVKKVVNVKAGDMKIDDKKAADKKVDVKNENPMLMKLK